MTPTPPPYPHAGRTRDHWWWRPGWRFGRSFYTWFFTFQQDDALHRLVRRYQSRLASLDGLDLVPVEWLHLTVQGLGFTDEITSDERERVTDAVRQRLEVMPVVQLTFGPVVVHPEAIVLPADPAGAAREIRDTIRAATADQLGVDRVDGASNGYRPHVSVAYNRLARDTEALLASLSSAAVTTERITVTSVSLVDLNRDEYAYRWHLVPNARVSLGVNGDLAR